MRKYCPLRPASSSRQPAGGDTGAPLPCPRQANAAFRRRRYSANAYGFQGLIDQSNALPGIFNTPVSSPTPADSCCKARASGSKARPFCRKGHPFCRKGHPFCRKGHPFFCNKSGLKLETRAGKPDTGTINLYITGIYLFTGAAVKYSRQTAIFLDRFLILFYDYLNTILIAG
jgi:hypothetical protein